MTNPSIEDVKALDGRIFATLSCREQEILTFYRDQGRKFGVSVTITNKSDSALLVLAASRQQADEILKSTNSVVAVTVAKNSGNLIHHPHMVDSSLSYLASALVGAFVGLIASLPVGIVLELCGIDVATVYFIVVMCLLGAALWHRLHRLAL